MRMEAAQSRRKSSSWKGFNLKRQISKVNMKLTNTFGDSGKRGSVFYYGATEGTPLSPVEISPDSQSNSETVDSDKSDYLVELEKDIVQSIADLESKPLTPETLGGTSQDNTASNSDQESEPTSLSEAQSQLAQGLAQSVPKSILQGVDVRQVDCEQRKQRTMSQPQALPSKRVDFSDECTVRSLATNLEGARLSRPSELPLFDETDRPMPPPRTKKKDKRDQRLLSVPNIKYVRQDSTKMRDLRSRSDKDQASSFAGSLIRRFSKYLLRVVLQSAICVRFPFSHTVNAVFVLFMFSWDY